MSEDPDDAIRDAIERAEPAPAEAAPQPERAVGGLRVFRGGRARAPLAEVRTFTVEPLDSLTLDKEPAALVEDLIEPQSLVVLYGASNTGKTFWTIELAGAIAAGFSWRGRTVQQSAVVYFALEGGRGVRRRLIAWRREHWKDQASGVPLFLVRSSVNLLDPAADTQAVIEEVRRVARTHGVTIGLVVVDTLARALAGGNENAPEDMGALVMNTDRIREETGATVLFVHHCGKDQAAGARGHSSLRAAIDTELELVEPGGALPRECHVRKQREFESGDRFPFRLLQRDLGVREDGKPISTCVVEQVFVSADDAADNRRLDGVGGHARQLFAILRTEAKRHGEAGGYGAPDGVRAVLRGLARSRFVADLVAAGTEGETARRAFNRAVKDLVDEGVAGASDEGLWLVA